MTETHTCPRRMNEFGPWEREEGLDEYNSRGGLVGQPRSCSFCGSMPPEDFMEAVRTGCEIGPTDKSYKLYVKGIPRDGDPDEPRVLTVGSHPHDGLRSWKELTRAEKKAERADASRRDYRDRYYNFTLWGPTVEGKFYTSHLSEEQGWEFHRLWQEHKINWGYPGAPYRPLFIPGPSTQKESAGS